MGQLIISHLAENLVDRVPLDYRIRIYLMSLITDQILTPKKVIINSKWSVFISVYFVSESMRDISIVPTTTDSSLGEKTNIVFVNKSIFIDKTNILHKYVFTVLESIDTIISSQFKKVISGEIKSLISKVDFNYLEQFDYPANFENQLYLGDY